MFNYFLGVALVAAPIFIKTGLVTTTVMSQEYFLVIMSMLGVFLFGIPRVHINIKILGISLFALAFTSVNPFGLYPLYQLMMCISGVAWIALVCSHARDIDLNIVKKCLAIACVIQSLWIIAQFIGISPYSIWMLIIGPEYKVKALNGLKVFGSLGNPNHSAALIACTMPFLRIRYWPLPITALYLGNSALPVICAVTGICAYLSYKKEKYFIFKLALSVLAMGAALLIFGLIPYGHYLSDSSRILAWKTLYQKIGIQFYGKGFGYISEVFSKTLINGEKFYQMHNEWIELYAIGGLLSVAVGVYLILPVIKNRGNPEINACLIALVINSLGNFTFHIAPLFMVFGTCYALQLAKE